MPKVVYDDEGHYVEWEIGDCLELMKDIPDGSIDLVVTDPPYGINYYSGHYKHKNPHQPIINDDELFIPLDTLWKKVKSSGAIFSFFSHKVPLVYENIRNIIIWVKNNWSAGDLKGDFGNQYECIAFIPKEDFKLNGARLSNVWNFNRVPPSHLCHPTQKPLPLIQQIILCASKEDDTILDPFLGSGTTLLACRNTGRNGIGFEINPDYEPIIKERIKVNQQAKWKEYFGDD